MEIRPIEDNSNKVITLYKEGKIDEETLNDTLASIDETALKIAESEITPAIIPFPYEEVKSFILNDLSKYKNMVVTEENLAFAEKVQRSLGGLAKKFDDYRKDKKKAASVNIGKFEDRVNEIKNLVIEVQEGIKKQTSIFEENRRQEQIKKVEAWIEEITNNLELSGKYKEMLTIQDKYLNKTQKEADTKNDLNHRANALLEMQKQEEQLESLRKQKVEMAKTLCESTSAQMNLIAPIEVADLGNLDEAELVGIIDLVNRKALERKEWEEKAKAVVASQSLQPEPKPREVQTSETEDYSWYSYRLKFNQKQKESFDKWLTDRGVEHDLSS
jgi:Protein of unknown function (DUF1351).